MMAIVHFAAGITAALILIIPFVDSPSESTILISSGLWALVPDLNKFFEPASAIHESILSNIFWFHGIIDALETGNPRVGALISLIILVLVVVAKILGRKV